MEKSEAATGCVLYKNVLLEILQNSQENTCATVSFFIKLHTEACNFIKNETLSQAFSCEFCKISKSTFFTKHFRTTASEKWLFSYLIRIHTCFFCASNFTYAVKLKLYREFSLIKELSVDITKKLLLSVKYTCVTWYVTVLTFISCQVISLL